MPRNSPQPPRRLLRQRAEPLQEVRSGAISTDTPEHDTAEQRAAPEAVRAVHAARDLARGEEPGDRLPAGADDARLGVDLETAHRVVQDGGHDRDVEEVGHGPFAGGEELDGG